ncbi:hypothetical protein LDENG_00094220 [Lucifuga dentata]|nr:hypothetical protein LDENG_00094220 [Lucifuga dentata]
MGAKVVQMWQQIKAPPMMEKKQSSINATFECLKEMEKLNDEQLTGQLVKELEQTQKELSRLQQLNKNLQDELQQERVHHSKQGVCPQLQAQRRSQEEAREAELRRRIDLLSHQAHLLVTDDATALAQAHLEQDRRCFHEQQVEWEHYLASLKSQLGISEEHRREAESHLMQLQEETQSYKDLQQETENLRKHLQALTTQLQANEEAQAQKEARLQKHLVLLQASQERERRSLAVRLAQAEQHSQDLQERLDRAEEKVNSLNKCQTWTREIEEAQQQLQEELARTISAVQRLQEEREELNHHCQELQNQLSEADGEVSRLKNRLKTDETHYYNLEHAYERVCEELQLALGQVQHRESETQDMREGYERLLDSKEQELSEVLLKMEVLGNSLEETEMKLNEVLKASQHDERQQTAEPLLVVKDSGPKEIYTGQSSESPHAIDVLQVNGNYSNAEHVRIRSCSIDSSYQHTDAAGDDPGRFMSVIKLLKTKLYMTEEKLREVTQRLEENESHTNCQDPHLFSQLTQSRATAQHLSLMLHSKAKQSQCFAQETEKRSRVIVDRFQAALKIVQACREKVQARDTSTSMDATGIEKQLASAASCLQQGEKDAEKQQQESQNASKGEEKIINDDEINVCASRKFLKTLPLEDNMGSISRSLMKELFVVEKIVSVLQSQHCQLCRVSGVHDGDVAHRYKSIISQIISLKMEQERVECDNSESFENVIGRVCAEAELIYAALKFQQQYESITQGDPQVHDTGVERPLKGPVKCDDINMHRKDLAHISPLEMAAYVEQEQVQEQSDDETTEIEREPDWLQKLVSQLQRRAKFLRKLCQEISDCNGEDNVDHDWVNDSAVDFNWVQEHAKVIYLSERLHLDLEQELLQSKVRHSRLQAKCVEQDVTLKDEQEALTQTLCQLQEDNSVLREELERVKPKIISLETRNQQLLKNIHKIEDYHEERMQKLETEFQAKIRELQQIHEEEMKCLHGHYSKCSCICTEKHTKSCTEASSSDQTVKSGPPENEVIMEGPTNQDKVLSMGSRKGQTTELDTKTKAELRNQTVGGEAVAVTEIYYKDVKKLKAFCDQGLRAMEEKHRKLVSDLQQHHQIKVAALLKEKDRLLQEETAATRAAIVAMRRAHKEELEKSRRSQHIRENSDISRLHTEYEKEIQLLRKELEVLSVQHTQKCLQNSQLSQELQDERGALMQYQKENQELKKKQDKVYAQNMLKTLYASSPGGPQHEIINICEDFNCGTWCPSRDCPPPGQSHEDTETNKSDAIFKKKVEKASMSHQIRGGRSKSLKEGLTEQERMKLFD